MRSCLSLLTGALTGSLVLIASSCSAFSTGVADPVADASSDAPPAPVDPTPDAAPVEAGPDASDRACPDQWFCAWFDGPAADTEFDGVIVKPAEDRATSLSLITDQPPSAPKALRLTVKSAQSLYDHETYLKKSFDVGTRSKFVLSALVRVAQANKTEGELSFLGLAWGTVPGLQSLAYFELKESTIIPRIEDSAGNPAQPIDFTGEGQGINGTTWRKLSIELAFVSPTEAVATFDVGGTELAKKSFAATQPPAGHVEVHVGSMGAFGTHTGVAVDYDDVKFSDR